MSNIFNSVKIKLQRKNKFNLSFASRLTTEFGRLTPFLFEEVLPNDTFKIKTAFRCQFAPLKFPVMQKFTLYAHYFFVPRRLAMNSWEDFITRGDDGTTIIPYPVVALDEAMISEFEKHTLGSGHYTGSSSLWDYLGFPSIQDGTEIFTSQRQSECHTIDILPFKVYQLVYNEWYRDQTLSKEIEIYPQIDGVQNAEDQLYPDELLPLFELRNRAWKKDYFTSALPDPQRGPDVTLPLVGSMSLAKVPGQSDNIPVTIDHTINTPTGEEHRIRNVPGNHAAGYNVLGYANGGISDQSGMVQNLFGHVDADDVINHVEARGGEIRSATINEVRRAFAIQRWYELAARAGNRYIEQILAHFGIRSSDARLQRPEYIGGAAIPVNVGDILQTSESGDTPLGTPAGIAQAAGIARLNKRKFTSEEHGYIIGILSVIPTAAYPQGLPRKFQRRSTFDFAWPLLANIGEQEIKRSELFHDWRNAPSFGQNGFGYTPRYAEYKYNSDQVHGDFRTSLLDFHDARFFDTAPVLNSEFIEVDTSRDGEEGLNRIFAVTESQMTDHLWISLYNDIRGRRVLPKYGTPI